MKKIGIIGATGYTGEELLKSLIKHQNIDIVFLTSEREKGTPVSSYYPSLPGLSHLSFISVNDCLINKVDLVFICLHAGESVKWTKPLLENGVRVIDLGSDFRFKSPKDYKDWYHMDYPYPELLKNAVYGLTEWHREEIRTAQVVGNPGCYPTSVLLALLPFLKEGIIENSPIIIDSKSGVSGAGKNPTSTTHYVSVNENISPYKVGRIHRHVGEMEKELKLFGRLMPIIFTPHLVPLTRGMLSTIYFELKEDKSKIDLFALLEQSYANEPFIILCRDYLPEIKFAVNTNYCFIGVEKIANTNMVILFSAIDNLAKGASTQAVQNMNVMLGFEEKTGLI